jgi:hypothetical protein
VGVGEYQLGIDFGTSSTVAALAEPDGRVRPLLFDASPLLASGVFAGPEAEMLTGADADRAAMADPGGFEPNPKRRIDDGTVWLGERAIPVVDMIAAVLGRVVTEAHRVAGGPIAGVVLTHPASWGRTRLDLLADAVHRAGLGEVGFVAEPVAAAAYFVTVLGRRLPPGRCLVVYDLGAGTFDVSIVRRSAAVADAATPEGPAGFEVIAQAGLSDVGGLDLDAAVVAHARALTAAATVGWGRLDWPQIPEDRQARHMLWRQARAAKEQLSRHAAADLRVPLIDTSVHLTREEFETAAAPLLDRTVGLTHATLREAGVPPEMVAGVFLVGGSSRIPLAATLLHRGLRIAPTIIDHPELVVAEGSLRTAGRSGPVPRGASSVPAAAVPAELPAPPTAAVTGARTALRGRPLRLLGWAAAVLAAVGLVRAWTATDGKDAFDNGVDSLFGGMTLPSVLGLILTLAVVPHRNLRRPSLLAILGYAAVAAVSSTAIQFAMSAFTFAPDDRHGLVRNHVISLWLVTTAGVVLIVAGLSRQLRPDAGDLLTPPRSTVHHVLRTLSWVAVGLVAGLCLETTTLPSPASSWDVSPDRGDAPAVLSAYLVGQVLSLTTVVLLGAALRQAVAARRAISTWVRGCATVLLLVGGIVTVMRGLDEQVIARATGPDAYYDSWIATALELHLTRGLLPQTWYPWTKVALVILILGLVVVVGRAGRAARQEQTAPDTAI